MAFVKIIARSPDMVYDRTVQLAVSEGSACGLRAPAAASPAAAQ